MPTKIAWASETINPIRAIGPDGKDGYHCVKIDPACANCYAELFNGRRLPGGGTGLGYVANSPVTIFLDKHHLFRPQEWKKSKIIFPCSMTDWVGEFVDPRFSAAVLASASMFGRHVYLFLTKRPARLLELLTHDPWQEACRSYCDTLGLQWRPGYALNNVWLGFSAGTQKSYDKALPAMNAVARLGWNTWCSCEPMLESIDLRFHTIGKPANRWCIFGGESGNKARPFSLEGVRDGLRQCDDASVPAFVKQLGRHPTGDWRSVPEPVGRNGSWWLRDAGGEDPAEWPADLQGRREYPFELA